MQYMTNLMNSSEKETECTELGKPGRALDAVKSHPECLTQSDHWPREHLTGRNIKIVISTAYLCTYSVVCFVLPRNLSEPLSFYPSLNSRPLEEGLISKCRGPTPENVVHQSAETGAVL